MKVALVFLALIGLGFSAPQPRKVFHEHFEEFLDIIMEESSEELDQIFQQYLEYDEFKEALDYISTNSFKDLVDEMEHLPEFGAVFEYLENDNIDIHYFLDIFNEMLANINIKRSARLETSGKDFSSFIEDCITVFPKDKLAALYDEKMANDDEFRTAIENLQVEEWDTIFTALWDSEIFQAEVQTLAAHGIDMRAVLHEIIAIFGQ